MAASGCELTIIVQAGYVVMRPASSVDLPPNPICFLNDVLHGRAPIVQPRYGLRTSHLLWMQGTSGHAPERSWGMGPRTSTRHLCFPAALYSRRHRPCIEQGRTARSHRRCILACTRQLRSLISARTLRETYPDDGTAGRLRSRTVVHVRRAHPRLVFRMSDDALGC